ncbi:MAG: glucuronate isomerase, partial [Bacteroidota bacterium]
MYHDHARHLPILDFHSHLSPADIAGNRCFANLTEAWLEGDHYKWRAMRANGVAEHWCSGKADPREKFNQWAATVPFTLRNPLFHWTHLELKNYFGISDLLNATNADQVYDRCSALLQQPEYHVQGLMKRMNVEVACTTDDPADSLEHHRRFAEAGGPFRMLPTFRPDKVYKLEDASAWNHYIDHLGAVSGSDISTYVSLVTALHRRADFFQSLGCRLSDHGLEALPFVAGSRATAPLIFDKIRSGKSIDLHDQETLRSAILLELGELYHSLGWVQQFHLGAIRNNNSRKFRELGPDTGFDSIGDVVQIRSMGDHFDALDSSDRLARTIVYNLHPAYNELFATMAGNFNDGSVPGKMQFGSGWWFLDQKDGMEKQLNALSNMGLLSRFVGMVTDSRSFLSFPRHEYFRRILCNLIGRDVMNGELPDDMELMSGLVTGICHRN